jgi:hypothetical protein
MTDLKSPRLIYAKGLLFLLVGLLSAGVLLLQSPDWRVALLLTVAIWSFCRAYYFAFYVIEHYVDRAHRFSGLGAFAAYLWRQRRGR